MNSDVLKIDDREIMMILELRDICYAYGGKLNIDDEKAIDGIRNINLSIDEGEFIGIIGHTGSGKSTLVQHMNGLIKANSGDIIYRGSSIYDKNFKLSNLRKNVGLVFQYPEYQLFKPTILEDVEFGPMNKYGDKDKAREMAISALKQVGIGEELYESSPFEISGGQKRRVAIAGVLAMNPEILILDEPTAGLDPKGRDEILGQIKKLQTERGIAVVLVSHSMEDVARYVDRIVVMNDGVILYDDTPKEVFAKYRELEIIGLSAPAVTYLMEELKNEGIFIDGTITTVEEAVEKIEKYVKK